MVVYLGWVQRMEEDSLRGRSGQPTAVGEFRFDSDGFGMHCKKWSVTIL